MDALALLLLRYFCYWSSLSAVMRLLETIASLGACQGFCYTENAFCLAPRTALHLQFATGSKLSMRSISNNQDLEKFHMHLQNTEDKMTTFFS
jgi:hypothetical protein